MAQNLHQLSAAYALDALDAEDERVFEAHLEGCDRCRADVDSFRVAASSLAFADVGPAPPAGLRDRVLDGARAERSNVIPFRSARRLIPPALAAAAAVVVVGLWASSNGGSSREIPLRGANGTLVVKDSGRAELAVSGLRPAPAGKTYEIWVMSPAPRRAGLLSGGTAGSKATLTERVPRGATVAVTLERAGGVDAPTGRPLFTAPA